MLMWMMIAFMAFVVLIAMTDFLLVFELRLILISYMACCGRVSVGMFMDNLRKVSGGMLGPSQTYDMALHASWRATASLCRGCSQKRMDGKS